MSEKGSGAYVGDLGFADFHRPLEPPIDGVPEAGWAFVRAAHGKGYATEALKAVTEWLDGTGRHPRSVCIISPGNLASIRVAEKAGYRPEAPRAVYRRSSAAAATSPPSRSASWRRIPGRYVSTTAMCGPSLA